jgi:hypothetical protein
MALSFASLKGQLRQPFKVHNLFVDGGVASGGTPKYPLIGLNPTEAPTYTAEGGLMFDDDTHTPKYYNGSAWKEFGSAVTDADGQTVAGVIVPTVMIASFRVGPHATVTEYDLMVAPRAMQVTRIDVVPSTLQGGALTATVVKAVGTDTPVKTTTPMHTADSINLNSGAYTVQNVTLTATTADLVLAAGNRIAIDYSAALTAGHAAVTISYKYV